MKNYKQFINEDITFQYHKELNTKFWTDFELDQSIRNKLLNIAKDFYKTLETNLEIKDIELTGSLANFNYNKHSDLDVHIILDFSESDSEIKVVQSDFNGKRFIWNMQHDIVIRGHDVELYVQDINEQHTASGLFSLMNNKWIVKPSSNKPEVDEKDIEVKFNTYKDLIDKLEEKLKDELSPDDIELYNKKCTTLFKKIVKDRKESLHMKRDEFSVENLVFKELRNTGYLEKLKEVENKFYDKIYAQ